MSPSKEPLPARACANRERASSVHERLAMTKYKLEYIWLDGYKPVRTSWQDADQEFERFSRRLRTCRCGALTAPSTQQAEEATAPIAC